MQTVARTVRLVADFGADANVEITVRSDAWRPPYERPTVSPLPARRPEPLPPGEPSPARTYPPDPAWPDPADPSSTSPEETTA